MSRLCMTCGDKAPDGQKHACWVDVKKREQETLQPAPARFTYAELNRYLLDDSTLEVDDEDDDDQFEPDEDDEDDDRLDMDE